MTAVRQGISKSLYIRVGIQGGLGSFHHRAVDRFFESENTEIVCIDSFYEVFQKLSAGDLEYAMVALENNTAGLLHTNYKLLYSNDYSLVGEVKLPIAHHLLALKETNTANLKEIHSHPMAILQCLDFLKTMQDQGVKIVETVDTAWSAKEIAEENKIGYAAIAGAGAADLYRLNFLNQYIQSRSDNYTRFVCVTMQDPLKFAAKPKGSAAVLKALVSVTVGRLGIKLAAVLELLEKHRFKIGSIVPITTNTEDMDYVYAIELVFQQYSQLAVLEKELEKQNINIKNKGVYELYSN